MAFRRWAFLAGISPFTMRLMCSAEEYLMQEISQYPWFHSVDWVSLFSMQWPFSSADYDAAVKSIKTRLQTMDPNLSNEPAYKQRVSHLNYQL